MVQSSLTVLADFEKVRAEFPVTQQWTYLNLANKVVALAAKRSATRTRYLRLVVGP